MAVTTVSPSPASPTDGDDLCETDVTIFAIQSLTLVISLCGLLGNGPVFCLFRQRLCNIGMVYLPFSDFIFLLFIIPSTPVFLVEDVSCSPTMPLMYLYILFQLSVASCYWALLPLTIRSNILYMDKFFNPCCHCNIPTHLLWLVYGVLYCAFFALFTLIPAVTNLCPSQQHCRAALISMYTIILLLFAAPMLISSTVKFIKVKRGSKRRDIVLFLMVIFILLLILCNFLQQFGYTSLSSPVFFLLNCIQSSFKPFIYFLAGRCWSPCALSSLWRVFDEQEEEAAHSSMEEEAPMDTGV